MGHKSNLSLYDKDWPALIWLPFMVSAIFASSFSLISQQDTFPPSARSTTWRRVEPSLTCLSSAINIQHSLSLHKLHSVIAVGYTDEFSHAFFFKCFLINLLFPRHSGWEFQKHLLFSYLWLPLQSHWPDAASADFKRSPTGFKGSTLRWQLSALKNPLSFFSLCLRLMCKHKHRWTNSSSFSDALYLASLGVIFLLIGAQQLCQPKVRDFHMLRSLNEDISGSKVTVHQATFLQIVHSLQYNRPLVSIILGLEVQTSYPTSAAL